MRRTDLVIRTTNEEDWQAVRALRLEMLRDYPLAYGDQWSLQPSARGVDGGVDHAGPLLVGVYVSPDYRGDVAGVSRLLLDAVEDWARLHGDTLRLEVHEDNPRARRFYEKLGFTMTGRSREY